MSHIPIVSTPLKQFNRGNVSFLSPFSLDYINYRSLSLQWSLFWTVEPKSSMDAFMGCCAWPHMCLNWHYHPCQINFCHILLTYHLSKSFEVFILSNLQYWHDNFDISLPFTFLAPPGGRIWMQAWIGIRIEWNETDIWNETRGAHRASEVLWTLISCEKCVNTHILFKRAEQKAFSPFISINMNLMPQMCNKNVSALQNTEKFTRIM